MLNSDLKNAIKRLQLGKMVILTDAKDRENEGDLIIAAEHTTAEDINFMLNHAKGVICLSLDESYFKKFNIPMQPSRNHNDLSAPFGLSIEAAHGVSSGVSAHDRAHTIQTIINTESTANDISIPGHVFTLKAKPGGVLERAGHTEGSIELMTLAGLNKAAVICEIMNADGSMARDEQLQQFAAKHRIPIVDLSQLINHKIQQITAQKMTETIIPTKHYGKLFVDVYRHPITHKQALIIRPEQQINTDNPITRIHSSCFTGDILSSLRCDCGEQLQQALTHIVKHNGFLIYLDQEGRDIGLVNKIKAYALQDQGMDTVQANVHLNLPIDNRDYLLPLAILRQYNVTSIQLISNNPKKIDYLIQQGIQVTPIHLQSTLHQHNKQYLTTKKEKLNHHIHI